MTGVWLEVAVCGAAAAYAALRVQRARADRDNPPTYRPRHART